VLVSSDGTKIEVEWPEPDGRPGVFVFAFHKSGSVLLEGLCRALCEKAGRSRVNAEGILFNKGFHIEQFEADLANQLPVEGIVNGVYRTMLDGLTLGRFNRARFVVLIRNPLDAIVSYYFSILKSHYVPKSGDVHNTLSAARSQLAATSLNSALVSGQFDYVFANMARFGRLIKSPIARDLRLYRYEDVIYDKRRWVRLLAADLDTPVDQGFVDQLLPAFEVFPDEEDDSKHVRQVRPGDYLRKLDRSTIIHLVEKHAEVFKGLGYKIPL